MTTILCNNGCQDKNVINFQITPCYKLFCKKFYTIHHIIMMMTTILCKNGFLVCKYKVTYFQVTPCLNYFVKNLTRYTILG